MRSILFIFILLLLTSCSKKKPEQVEDAIDVAQTYLSSGKCAKAIEALEDVGRQNDNAIYLQVLASAYACQATYSEIVLLTALPYINTSSLKSLASGLSLFDISTDSDNYVNLRTAMNIILDADGGDEPSQQRREDVYGTRKAGDMGMQLLLMNVVQLGNFLNIFGNVDELGVKGAGTGTNSCFIDYNYVTAQTIITALPATNNCNSNTAGHPDLDLTTTDGKRRACEGLMLITNLLDVLENIDVSGDDNVNELADVADLVNGYKDIAIAADPALETLLTTTSQAECESLLGTASEVNNLQLIYAFIFETGLE